MTQPARLQLIGSFAVWLACVVGCQPGNGQKPIPTSRTSLPAALETTRIAFADVAKHSGLVFSLPKQARPMRTLEAFGSGCAAFDGDNDGWQDVLVVADPRPVLFRNVGGGKFQDVTQSSGLAELAGHWIGCAIGDYDGDGLLDILLTGFQRLALYKNLGGMRFQLATEEAGLDPSNHGLWGSSAGFMDLDGDQYLDLVVINFIEFGPHVTQYCEPKPGVRTGCRPQQYVHQKGEIWRNTSHGRFELVPPENGMADTNGVGLVLAFSDVNHDGRMDFYIGNDGIPSDMLLNRGDMKFENIGTISGLAYDGRGAPPASMGSDWADYDRDGQLDLAISNFQDSGFLVYRNLDDNQFLDWSIPTGLATATLNRLGFGTKWVDLDNDAWVDIFFVNGHVYDNVGEAVGPHVTFRQPLSLFQNRQGQVFVDVTPQMGQEVLRPLVGRGSATADFNNDGRIDLLGIDFEGPVMLLENRSQTGSHWITLDLRAAAPNVYAYGAALTAKAGGHTWVGVVSPASSYLSSSDPRVHWGLGAATSLDELTIRWPGGKIQTLRDVKADQILRVDQEP
jgi:enediyne biosynthesis protein E4